MPTTGERKDIIEQIDIKDLRESPFNLRKEFDATSLAELAQSIHMQGIIQPLLVRPLTDGLAYEIVAGARRFRAAKLAGLKSVPCLVRNLNEEQARTEQILENLQRQDITALEEASGFQELLKTFKGFAAEDGTKNENAVMALAHSIGKSKEYVYSRLKLLKLEPAAQKSLAAGKLNPSQAVELVALPPERQKAMVQWIEALVDDRPTVRDVRTEIKYRFAPKPAPPKMSAADHARAKREAAANQKAKERWQAEDRKRELRRKTREAALALAAPTAWKNLRRMSKADRAWYLTRILIAAGEEFNSVPEAFAAADGKPIGHAAAAFHNREKRLLRAAATGEIIPVLALSLALDNMRWHESPRAVAFLKRAGVNWKDCLKRAKEEVAAAEKAAAAKVQTSANKIPPKPEPPRPAAGKKRAPAARAGER